MLVAQPSHPKQKHKWNKDYLFHFLVTRLGPRNSKSKPNLTESEMKILQFTIISPRSKIAISLGSL